ncbi:MAG: sulfatase-like hydrolase/transferase, partial [Clostridia bacterium]|nr:sulfatase-like hydrolase/transferase [Clostridia bacterium]
MKKFLKSNCLIWIYFGLVTLIELVAVFVTSNKFYIRSPLIFLLIQLFILLILLSIPSNKARHITAYLLLIFFMVVDLVFIVIYEMTETIFDYGMFNLRNDAMAILESIPINFMFFAISMLAISLYIVFGGRYVRHAEPPVSIKWWAIPSIIVTVSSLGVTLWANNKNFESDVTDKLYRASEASYAEYGVVGNFLNEFVKGAFFSHVKLGNEQQLEDFIYSADGIYQTNFETTEEYNVVTILSESLEWHGFIQDFKLFVNGYNIDYTQYSDAYGNTYSSAEQILRELYPNLYDFYDSSIVMSNFYSREKTDIAENLSLLGSYPTNAYINYDFPKNELPTAMANVLKTLDSDITCNYFHNGGSGFYNRSEYMKTVGFDSCVTTEQMKKLGMTDYSAKGERNLDADMIEVCADKMFPKNQRFYTYITSITMHGQYTYRKNLAERGYYNDLAKFGIKAKTGNSFEAFNYNNFYYYIACVMEFDRALGAVMDKLEENGLKDNTIICVFGDHNTYYSSLSNYVKGIDDTNDDNYTNLFRVPCMIKVPSSISEKVENYLNSTIIDEVAEQLMNSNQTIDDATAKQMAKQMVENRYAVNKTGKGTQVIVKKFMCTADMLPTMFDLLGINVFGNLYFGHSAFEWQQSVLYSRAYDVFITDSMYFVSLNNIKYIRKDNPQSNNDSALSYADINNYDSDEHMAEVEIEAKKLLDKLSVCNRIFYNDYFGRKNI